jgi:hypothetical protein
MVPPQTPFLPVATVSVACRFFIENEHVSVEQQPGRGSQRRSSEEVKNLGQLAPCF